MDGWMYRQIHQSKGKRLKINLMTFCHYIQGNLLPINIMSNSHLSFLFSSIHPIVHHDCPKDNYQISLSLNVDV
jgi:hypothetical protein